MDKSLLKVSGMFSFIIGVICCATIVWAIVGIPMIIGGNKLKEIAMLSDEEIKEKKDIILIWTIVFLFICQISGILSLIFYLTIDSSTTNKKSSYNKYDELEKIKKLYDDKVLSKEEFESEKEKILNN